MSKVTDPDDLDRFQIAIDPSGELVSLRGEDAIRVTVQQTGDTDGTATFTDTANGDFITDSVTAGDVLSVISDPAEDGGIIGHYRVVGSITATTFTVDRTIIASTAADLTYRVNEKQSTGGTPAAVADGVNMQTLFSFLKEEWITFGGGLGNAVDLNKFDFPIVAISSAAGQYILGGVNGDAASAWVFATLNGTESTDDEGNPRELIRDGGWQERNASNVVISEYASYTTLGSLDSDTQAYYQQGDGIGTPANFKLTGPVNQAVLTFGPDVGPDAGTGFNIDNATKRITRNDGGNWATDNYRIGDYITNRDAEDGPNDGSFGPITVVQDQVDGYIEIPSATFTTNTDDVTIVVQVDHRRYTKLFARKKARSYSSAIHADAGIPTTGILPLVNKFPLAHATDPAIVLEDGQMHGDPAVAQQVFQEVETHSTDTTGVTTDQGDGTFTFDAAAVSPAFNDGVLRAGDALEITSGSYQGFFEVKSVDDADTVTCYHEPLLTYPGNESTLSFTMRTGVRDQGSAVGAIADVDGDTGTLTDGAKAFDTDGGLGLRIVAVGDMLVITAGTGAHIGVYKVTAVAATILTVNTSDQIFTTQSNQTFHVMRPGMHLQRFETDATEVGPITSIDFNDLDPDTIDRNDAGDWGTDGFDVEGMMLTVTDAETPANDGTYILSATFTATTLTLIAEETLTDDQADVSAVVNGESGIQRTINSIAYPFHWRLFANAGSLAQIFQYVQHKLRRPADIDESTGTERGDITDLLMTFASPNGVTLDLFPDDLATGDLNNVTYQDMSGDSRNNAFLVGILFDVNANLISSANARLTAYFTSVPSGDFGTNNAVIVDDKDSVDMDFTVISGDIQTTFDYTNNSQGGRTPDTDAAITVVALGDDLAQHILTTTTITKVNSLTVSVQPALERNYSNP